MSWFMAAGRDDLAAGGRLRLKVGNTDLLLLMIGGEVFALKNQCPHLGCAMHRGKLEGYLLWCPCHDWIFDVRTGEFVIAPEIKIPVFPVKVVDGKIMVNMEEE